MNNKHTSYKCANYNYCRQHITHGKLCAKCQQEAKQLDSNADETNIEPLVWSALEWKVKQVTR